jgi:glycosyltransferase involved in cell wall biosynthesis
MASGCVPVASKTRAFPEIIQNGENGFLIDLHMDASGDAHRTATTSEEKQKLTQRLETTIKELIEIAPDDWLRLSSSCRAHIQEHHNPERHRESLLAIYQSGL